MSEKEPPTLWLNKRSLRVLELGFAHEIETGDGGWEINAEGDGELSAEFADGKRASWPVSSGDVLALAGDDVYVVRAKERDGGVGRPRRPAAEG